MQEVNVKYSPECKEIYGALVKAQSQMKRAVKDKTNTFFNNSKYADLSSTWDACQEQLNSNGIAVVSTMRWNQEAMATILITRLIHTSGQWIESECPIRPAKQNDPQSFGAAVTYMRRFCLASIVNICPEDDDAEKERQLLARQAKMEEERRRLDIYPKVVEIEELNKMLMECPRDYRARMVDGRNQKGWFSFEEMPFESFKKLKDDVLKNMPQKQVMIGRKEADVQTIQIGSKINGEKHHMDEMIDE